ncbi:MAG: MFS transporter [Deltaproteobacteria bacterium]|jgi:predicted MFS family arabinose efflux permease|nr:MFS transporter [Deltaproteobacteria bacterium]
MSTKAQKYLGLAILAWGGTFIYQVPMLRYVLYEPLREALNLNHTEFGNLQAWYGYLATATYFPGGWLADRISPRKLLTFSFLATAILGFWFSSFPSYGALIFIHAMWGVTTTLTFWAAMLRACKDMAASDEQGRFFGLLEGGRGLTNLIGTTIALFFFNAIADNSLGVQAAIWVKAGGCALAAVLTWAFFKDPVELAPTESVFKDIVATLKSPLVWALSLIVFCCYTAFTVGSYMNPYLTGISGISATTAGFLTTAWLYAGQFAAAPVSGFMSDKYGRPKFLTLCFVLLVAIYVVIIVTPGVKGAAVFTIVTFICFYLAIYAIRGIYFSVMEDMKIPSVIAGSAVGMASVIGFTPDFITFKVAGPILDKYPGATGYKYLFAGGAVVAFIGLLVCIVVLVHINNIKRQPVG